MLLPGLIPYWSRCRKQYCLSCFSSSSLVSSDKIAFDRPLRFLLVADGVFPATPADATTSEKKRIITSHETLNIHRPAEEREGGANGQSQPQTGRGTGRASRICCSSMNLGCARRLVSPPILLPRAVLAPSLAALCLSSALGLRPPLLPLLSAIGLLSLSPRGHEPEMTSSHSLLSSALSLGFPGEWNTRYSPPTRSHKIDRRRTTSGGRNAIGCVAPRREIVWFSHRRVQDFLIRNPLMALQLSADKTRRAPMPDLESEADEVLHFSPSLL